MKIESISGRDDLEYDVMVRDAAGAPVTTGSVLMVLCAYGTITPLIEGANASVPLTHQGAGRWTGTHDDAAVLQAISAVTVGSLFDRVVIVEGRGARRLARCRRVAVVGSR